MRLAEFISDRLGEHWAQAHRNIGAAEWEVAHAQTPLVRTRAEETLRIAERDVRIVEAQRRTLARHFDCGTGSGYCDDGDHAFDAGYGCPDLVDLAAADREHPDFNSVWAPAGSSD